MTSRSNGDAMRINRAPVITLWAAIVAERLGFDWQEALTLAHAVCGLNAYSKGRSLGLFKPAPESVRTQRRHLADGEAMRVELLHRAVPVVRTIAGLRAVSKDRPVVPGSVERYLDARFGEMRPAVESAMRTLAASLPLDHLADQAYMLYEHFRPVVPAGARGWGAAGMLDLDRVRRAAQFR